MAAEPIVRVRNIHKYFRRGSEQIDVLNDLSLDVPEGEFLALMGPSGSGKTTLLNLIAGLDQPSRGEVWVGDDYHQRHDRGRAWPAGARGTSASSSSSTTCCRC